MASRSLSWSVSEAEEANADQDRFPNSAIIKWVSRLIGESQLNLAVLWSTQFSARPTLFFWTVPTQLYWVPLLSAGIEASTALLLHPPPPSSSSSSSAWSSSHKSQQQDLVVLFPAGPC
ncbi:unnamed protein product [Pleuronectes platessa]|uniref:Uncharacterized protein n=1 Tax=Pleuronectes platessa TaxID=8262 RepID=A0A9N7UVX0_PLEPL|nr:unnamed protein product [Pleuronectes platessa]